MVGRTAKPVAGMGRSRGAGTIWAIALAGAMLLAPTTAGADDRAIQGFEPPVSDIDVAPDGSTVAVGGEVVQRASGGTTTTVRAVEVAQTSPEATTLNGVVAIGRSNFFVTSGGGDQAEGAALWRVTPGQARVVGDIEAFEVARDPDASAWKNVTCEENPPSFTAGPQSNPYHLAATSGGRVLVADAAGNSILRARANGTIDWLAVLTPPLVAAPSSDEDYRVLFPLNGDVDCYVQPVPTSVDTSPDGRSVFVGELTGVTGLSASGPVYETGLSRVWKIDANARHAVCSEGSGDPCRVAITGLTSVVDLAFGPDGLLYVAEFDTDGWLAPSSGGAVLACDVNGTLPITRSDCDEIVHPRDGVLVDAIAFDKRGSLRVLENGLSTPVVRHLSP